LSPGSLIEINGKKPAGLVRQQRVDTDCDVPGKMIVNHFVS
jgi:hypothetical protein